MKNAAWPAPAKLNLFLHITGRRADGYHELQTVFQFLDYGDELRFSARDDGMIRRVTDIKGVPEAEDLVVRAAQLLQAETGCVQGVDIAIDKRLPMGGGLGGGSSDAATTLVALNVLWGLGLSEDRLAQLGLRLGADVPVFVRGRAAWAEGVGERLTPVDIPEPWYVVLVPAAHVSTARLFSDPQLTRDMPPIRIRDFLAGQGCNVFEPLVRIAYPEVDAALLWLTQSGLTQSGLTQSGLSQAAYARMTGSGACVFAAFDTECDARAVAARVPESWRAFVAKGLNTSPLMKCVEALTRGS